MTRRFFIITLTAIICLGAFPLLSRGESAPELTAAQAVVMDEKTGQVVFNKNMNDRAFPASITKIMTALLTVEQKPLSDLVTVHESAVGAEAVPRDTTHIMLVDGEEMPLESLLYATMLPSANDAANGAAEYVAGSLSAFAEMMNERAAEIGCTGTNFVNANGLPDDNHYTTAYDMALITRTALQNDLFRNVFETVTYSAAATNKNTERVWATTHKMLKQGEYYYEGITGGKTGWTESAKYTAVTSAMRGGRELICVLLGCEGRDLRFSETTALLDYIFNNYNYITIEPKDAGTYTADVISDGYKLAVVSYSLSDSLTLLIKNEYTHNDITVTSSVKASYTEPVDEYITLTAAGEPMGTYPLTLTLSTLDEPVLLQAEKKTENGGFWSVVGKIFAVIGIIVLVAAVLFIILIVYAYIERKKRRERRRRQKREREREKTEFYFEEKE